MTTLSGILYALLASMLIPLRAQGSPEVMLDKDYRDASQHTDFAGRGRMTIPVDNGGGADQIYRVSIETRDPTRAPVFVSLRTASTPARTFWSGTIDPNETWTVREFMFQPAAHSERTILSLMTAQPRTLEIGHVKIYRESRDDVIARMKQEHPDGDRRQNLCRISRFPLGVQSGWGLDREQTDEQIELRADESVIGPSGSPALKFAAPGSMGTEVAPFEIPWPFIAHTASLYVRGHGHLTMLVLADAQNIGQADIDLAGDEWKRISCKFMPALLAETRQLQLITTGAIWIDAMQVEPGETATEYHSTLPCEVSLAIPKSQTSVPRIQFIDEPPVVDFAVTGKHESAVLKTKAVNLYGQEKALPDISMSNGEIRYDVFPTRPLGQFRIEAWVEDGSGNRISSFNELIVTRIRRPRHWNEDAPDSPFGIHMGTTTRHHLLAKAIGINWVRLHDAGEALSCWAFLEPHKGQWSFQDEKIERYRKHHIEVLGMLGTAPPWATGVPETPGGPGYWERWNEPRDLKDYANYCKIVANRYKDTIRVWDIWNEPWGKFWSKWDPATNRSSRSATAPEDFAKLQQAGYDAVKSVDPNLQLMGIDTMGGKVGAKWTAPLVDLGALKTADIYDYHFYNTELCGFPGDAADRTLKESFGMIKDLQKPIWMSEGNGANRTIVRGFYHYTLPPTVPSEDFVRLADYQSRYMARILSLGVKKIFLYSINVGGECRPGPGEFQCLVTDDGFAHPQAAAHSELAYELEDTHFARQVDPAKGIHAYIFAGKDRSVAVILSEPQYDKYVLPHPKDGAVRDLFGNDVKEGDAFRGTTIFASAPVDVTSLVKLLVSQSP